ncbi:MAG: sulfur carrier protein ThiS [Gemmatimonadota bacterium]|nr:sulfur carrier protein ThiS [Gemmatimonadota bacterium]
MSSSNEPIDIVVNGEVRAAERGATVEAFLLDHDLNPDLVVVERNGEILPRERYGDTRLRSEDRLEIVHFVGGG